MTFLLVTLIITIFSMILSIKSSYVTLVNDTQHNNALQCAGCRVLVIIMPNVILLSLMERNAHSEIENDTLSIIKISKTEKYYT
jgi:hypothetical protein